MDNTAFVAYYVDRFAKLLTTGRDTTFIGELDAVLNQEVGQKVHIELLTEVKKLKLQTNVRGEEPRDINIERMLNRSVNYVDDYQRFFSKKSS